MKIAVDGRDSSQFLVQKVLNKSDPKLRRKVTFTVKFWPISMLVKSQVYVTFRKSD